jgi:large subunit ribosomal protein L29
MKVKERLKLWREKSEVELNDCKNNLMKEYFNLRMQKISREFKHFHHFIRIKRDIARISTILIEKDRIGS